MGWLLLEGTQKTQIETQSLSVDFKGNWDLSLCKGVLEILHLSLLEASKQRDFATKTQNSTYHHTSLQATLALQ